MNADYARSPFPADLGRRLEGVHDPLESPEPLRHAAVMALLSADADPHDPTLLLIERSRALSSHAGQLAFPGGKPEPEDESLLDTALRECEEEVGLRREGVVVLGRLAPVPTPTGFMIVPFVARAPSGWQAAPTSPEVHRILRPRLRTLVEPGVHRTQGARTWRGRRYVLHEFAIHDPPLWGATARMAWDLLERVGWV